MAENNSISTMLPELLRLFNNSLESFEKVNQAITSSNESVTINIQNNDGTNSRVTIPSFGFLKNSVDRLQNNIDTITNVGGQNSSIRLSDGTFRKLVLAKLPTEAIDLTSINSIENFNIKPNWFFEELINPLLYVAFDITGQAPIDTERAIIQRYILDTNSQSKINFFESQYNGNAAIDYNTFLQEIVEKNNEFQKAILDGLQLAYKVTANSLYGQLGARTSPIYFKELAASTTATGRDLLRKARYYTESKYPGAECVYGDTDSIFVHLPACSIRANPALDILFCLVCHADRLTVTGVIAG